MRLFELFNQPVTEGGAMPGVGAVHRSEVKPTLQALQSKLGIDLVNNALGSSGKWEFSGDIDVAVQLDREDIPAFIEKLQAIPEIEEIKRSSVIMTRVKIANYDPSIETDRPRTGYVQVDFMPGDPDWMKTYYHSPSQEESQYKGVYRNILLSIIAAAYKRTDSDETTEDGRPLKSERFLWGVVRTPKPKKNGTGYTKQNINTVVKGPWRKADEIARVLNLGDASSLASYESLMAAINKNYPPELVQQIRQSFADNAVIQDKGVPEDLV
jgi:hypothetical protein